jgi:hypothetical protein
LRLDKNILKNYPMKEITLHKKKKSLEKFKLKTNRIGVVVDLNSAQTLPNSRVVPYTASPEALTKIRCNLK